MFDAESLFENRRADTEKLAAFGFVKRKGAYIYSAPLFDAQFELKVSVFKNGKVEADVFDSESGEIYAPLKIFGAKGGFVGRVKSEYKKILGAISEQCFCADVFKSEYTRKLVAYAKEKYGDDLEFLWPKFPRNAILRRKDNKKWYAAILNLPKNKIGLDGEELVDIIDLRIKTAALETLIDGKKYFPGFHMNKKHWLTICLDGSVAFKEICERLDASYALAKK